MIQAYFSNIRDIILNEIHNSKRDISIAVAWFTQRDLFNAIIGAGKSSVSCPLKPSDSTPLKHSTMPP